MKELKPVIKIKQNPQTSKPPNSDNTIMDDTVVLMDDSSALMGGLTTNITITKSKITVAKPNTEIKIRH